MQTWWNWVANEVNKHPREATKPPKTADSLVLFLLHIETHKGERNIETPIETDPNQPAKKGFSPD